MTVSNTGLTRSGTEDIERLEFLAAKGWLIVRVSARQLLYQREVVVRRVCNALAHRGCPL